jgi:3-hydroxy-5-methyl-1-naphthoate 3-O-methyltransferase
MHSTEIHSAPSPDPIFQMATGFWVSKTLMTAVELEVFSKLSGKSLSLNDFQKLLGFEIRPAEVFVTALVSLGLLEVTKGNDGKEKEGFYSNSALTDEYLVRAKPSYIGDFITMLDKRLYKSWDRLPQSLKSNRPAVETIGEEGNRSIDALYSQALSNDVEQDDVMRMFTHAMYGASLGPAMALPKVFDFSNYRKMMDIGGGPGVYPLQVVREFPNMSAVVIDSKPVCQIAAQYIKQSNLQDKIHTKPLDFLKEELPKECDVAFLSHILHGLSVEKDKILLKKVYDSLVPKNNNSVILISEWLLNDEKTGPVPSAMMSLNMILEMNEGRNYSFAEISNMLSDVGFQNIERRPLAGPAEIVIGYKK